MALQNAIIAVGSMVVQFVINGYGMLFLAGFTATNKLYGLLEIAATSYGFAVTSYVGQNLGARLVRRIKQGQRSAAVLALITSVVIAGAMLLFGRLVLGLFISGEPGEVEASLDIAYHYLSIMSVCLPILYMLHIYRSALMGLGDTVVPMLSGFAEMVVRIGVASAAAPGMGQEGIYYAEVGAWTAAAVLLVAAYYAQDAAPSPGARALPWTKKTERSAFMEQTVKGKQHHPRRDLEAASDLFLPHFDRHLFPAAVQHGGHHCGGPVCGHQRPGGGGHHRHPHQPAGGLFCGGVLRRHGDYLPVLRRGGRQKRLQGGAHLHGPGLGGRA